MSLANTRLGELPMSVIAMVVWSVGAVLLVIEQLGNGTNDPVVLSVEVGILAVLCGAMVLVVRLVFPAMRMSRLVLGPCLGIAVAFAFVNTVFLLVVLSVSSILDGYTSLSLALAFPISIIGWLPLVSLVRVPWERRRMRKDLTYRSSVTATLRT